MLIVSLNLPIIMVIIVHYHY
ncbi:hypothetical protein BLA29_014645 [Euroglyphus maynei]|uniref:Uncharacterized protein n=1 Tax=Euroglyphus maynei TaxID=6958 RepID=A0A1Y3B0K0_EURMA|nr:hypothetical protein BLA29_014645 [Euroglyphus maynei]